MASGSALQRAATFAKIVFSAAGETDLILHRICWVFGGGGGSRFRLRPIYLFS